MLLDCNFVFIILLDAKTKLLYIILESFIKRKTSNLTKYIKTKHPAMILEVLVEKNTNGRQKYSKEIARKVYSYGSNKSRKAFLCFLK